MSSSQRIIYLEDGADPVFAVVHPPTGGSSRDTAVILCPPFGWDEACSYRCRRDWAQQLAHHGYPCVRISLPGTGDSGGFPRDPQRLEAWTAAISTTARWLSSTLGARRVAAIGIGLGGLVAYRAIAHGAQIDDLVLWATPTRGRALVRELSVFAKLEVSDFTGSDAEPPPPLPSGDLMAGGFLLTAETVGALNRLDLGSLPLPEAPRRALLLERDGMAVDEALRAQLESCGVALTSAPGNGYALMTAESHLARTPIELIGRVTSWLDEASTSGLASPLTCHDWQARVDPPQQALVRSTGGVDVRETPYALAQPFGELVGVLTEPLEGRQGNLCAVLLNPGAIRRIGPSRMWVETARRWAARGVPTLRLDVQGIGDADGQSVQSVEELYVPELVGQVLAVLDQLQAQGVGDRFIVGGLCSGAYWAFHSAVQDPRVVAALMLNPRALIWDPTLLVERKVAPGVFRPSNWHKINLASSRRALANLGWAFLALRRLAATRTGRLVRGGDQLDELFDRLRDSGKHGMLLFSDFELLHDELVRTGHMSRLEHYENITLERIPVHDHTLRPSWAQALAHAALDRALDRELSRSVPDWSGGSTDPAGPQLQRPTVVG